MDKLGFREYVLNELLYDKTKGNNFAEIEKIFNNHKKAKIYRDEDLYNNYTNYLGELQFNNEEGERSTNSSNAFLFYKKIVKNKNAKHFLNEYKKRFERYFQKKRKFEEINWEEFKTYNELRPMISFGVENITEEELEKMRKEIKPYYNEKEIKIELRSPSKSLMEEND